jgi:hypothetical protein
MSTGPAVVASPSTFRLSCRRQRHSDIQPSQRIRIPGDPLQLSVLWHAAYMATFADFALLETSVGCQGRKLSLVEHDAVTVWARSEVARRCVMHGMMIQRHVQSGSVMSELAMHVPTPCSGLAS